MTNIELQDLEYIRQKAEKDIRFRILVKIAYAITDLSNENLRKLENTLDRIRFLKG